MQTPDDQVTFQGVQSAAVKITSPGRFSAPPVTSHVTKSAVRATPRAAAWVS
jgi:hypothetical protein